jgi:hypothetical protein
MSEIRNGIPTTELAGAIWRKSSRSGKQGNCVEMTWLPADQVALRNSRNPQGPALVYASADLLTFLDRAKKV